jgi:CRISPR/Cas system-associated endoribonuclease Cas2
MGYVEGEARKRRRKRNIQGALLAAVGAAGAVSVMLIAPNIFQALPRIAGDKYKLRYRAESAAGRLVQKGLARFVLRNGVRCLALTRKGKRLCAIERAKYALDTRYKRWDKRYRLVMFDVPHYRRSVRDRLRRVMQECGFLRLQDSVWVYPHDCEELLALVKAELRIGKDVLYAVVESLENDAWVKRHFGLRS